MDNKFKILSEISRESSSKNFYIAIYNGSLLVKREENEIHIVTLEEIKKLNVKYENTYFIGEFGGQACFTVEVISEIKLQETFELISLRELGPLIGEELFSAVGRANQILNWDKTHKFCGKCGSKTENKKDELAKVCPKCNHVMYPVICPAIIVAVTKGDEILLAHNIGFKDNLYSLIAGFVEAGEDLKSTVRREVFEEVGIKVKNIEFFDSSPWSFPNSLMLGFFAEYESGEIKVDGKEIVAANWFTKDTFPTIPQKFTLARKIIDEFINKNTSE